MLHLYVGSTWSLGNNFFVISDPLSCQWRKFLKHWANVLIVFGYFSIMELCKCLVGCFLTCILKIYPRKAKFTVQITVTFAVILEFLGLVSGLGSMSSIAVSYGGNGPVFCGLKLDGSNFVNCYGSNQVLVFATPKHLKFLGLTGGDGFVCGLLMDTNQPYCWGSSPFVELGVPQPMNPGSEYVEINAGDNHLCGLRKPLRGKLRETSLVDCWGYNMTANHVFDGQIKSISAGDGFNCGLSAENRTVFCWGDETNSQVIASLPKKMRFKMIASGGIHVCGIMEGVDSYPFCWGKSINTVGKISVSLSGKGNIHFAPAVSMMSIVSGRFHACGVKSLDRRIICWGFVVEKSSQPPPEAQVYDIAGGDYFTCGILGTKSLLPACWGYGAPKPIPDAVKPNNSSNDATGTGKSKFWAVQLPVIISEAVFAVLVVIVVFLTAVLYVRYRLRNCKCSSKRSTGSGSTSNRKIVPEMEEISIRSAKVFTYEELERATEGFKAELIVGRGSFSCVFKGVLKDGTLVAVKRALISCDQKKNSKEFHNELDLLSRLNHAHLLNLLGYCEMGKERLLVYEFMANGSLHQHLHGRDNALKAKLDWVQRVTIAVQASRGIEYLHSYACPPVIHRDIKSSNILIDEEHNARVADFGLSLLGPTDSSSPLAELPAGTLGYLDPEYYRLHYLTTKSDVYSFGVLLLEILSGRKAIDMKFEHGNIVEWAVPVIREGNVTTILDPSLKPPPEIESLRRIANVACKCVRMRGKGRPSMDKVTTSLERALALLMGTPCSEQPILPTEVVLGSSRMHNKPSQQSSNPSETELGSADDHRFEFRAPSWITFPSITSSQRRKSSVSESDVENARTNSRNIGTEGLVSLEEEIGPASPKENLFLKHNF